MYSYAFRPKADKQLQKLPTSIQKKIIVKIDQYVKSGRPLFYAKRLINSSLGSYRFRIDDYRVVFDVEEDMIVILAVGHRRDIYK